ncbi:MAG: LPS export ABC transporter periplasmic protein LptC [Candidatus Eremiobacteraeota bacterium]|nr:LPS export ABC transporter periplasmic protein LptC [Candidatus Eremiobacteraeota bacterium]
MIRPLLFILALALGGCTSAPPPAPEPTATSTAAPSKPKTPSNLLTEAGKTIIRTKKGRPWLMEAFKVHYQDAAQQAQLDNVDWTLSDSTGKKLIRIQAPKAVYRIEKELVEFVGGVQARRYDTRDLIKANKMTWNGKTGVLQGSEGVSWDRGQTHIQGDTATTTDKLERILVDGHVKVTTVLEGDPFDTGG